MSKEGDEKAMLVDGRRPFRVDQFPTKVNELYEDKADYKSQLSGLQKEINDLQRMMYAHSRYSMLLIFQAMDAAGKDGTIRTVMAGVNAHGVAVHAFQRPSTNELAHDFLWRTTVHLPKRGNIGIYNRSYYEEVLIAKVHSFILEKQNLPKECTADEVALWEGRYESIRDFEKHMIRNGTRVVKYFLHLSYDEQRNRFLKRIDKPEKNWKFEEQDIQERSYWADYQDAYEQAINETATKNAPWYIVPADDKKNMRLLVARILLSQLETLDMHYPEVTDERREELKKDREILLND